MTNDNEIIKALECCIKSDCSNCPQGKMFCSDAVPMQYAIDLINRQKAEIEALINGQETLQKHIAEKNTEIDILIRKKDALRDEIAEQQAEIERLHNLQKPTETSGFRIENGKVVFYTNMLNGYRHEYKDLDEIVKELNLYMHTDYKNIELISHYQHKAQTAKSETIKELSEKITEIFMRYAHLHSYADQAKRAEIESVDGTKGVRV